MRPTDPSSHTTPSSDTLDRYLAGESNVEERQRVELWLAAQPHEQRILHAIRDGIANIHGPVPPYDHDARLSAILQHSFAADQHGAQRASPLEAPSHRAFVGRQGKGGLPRARMFGVAVAAIVLSLVGVVTFGHHQTSTSTHRFQTAPGERATIPLADGSTVMLAPSTTVDVSPSSVVVEGEAYFTITPATSRAFVVKTRDASVQVLGTRFAVRQYATESHSRVVVEAGKVSVRPLSSLANHHTFQNPQPTIVSARALAQVTDSGITVTPGISTREYTAWTTGVLVFNKIPLRDVVADLGRAYGVTIRVEDSVLAREPMILEVAVRDQPLPQVLDLIGQAVDARYGFDGRVYRLTPGYAPKRSGPPVRVPQPEKQYGR